MSPENTPGWQDDWTFRLTNNHEYEMELIIEPEGDTLSIPAGHTYLIQFSPAFRPEVELEEKVVTVYGGPWYRITDEETVVRDTLEAYGGGHAGR